MSDSNKSPFNQQLTKWWDIVSAKDTWDSFKNFFALAWTILKETGILIWLFILGGLVSIGWIVDRSTELTESVKSLQDQANQTEEGNLLSEAGKSLWLATKKGADNALKTARTTLDIKPPGKKTKVEPPKQEKQGQQAPNEPKSDPNPKEKPKSESQTQDNSQGDDYQRVPDSQEVPEQ